MNNFVQPFHESKFSKPMEIMIQFINIMFNFFTIFKRPAEDALTLQKIVIDQYQISNSSD